jgi:FkbM family methyltransferase
MRSRVCSSLKFIGRWNLESNDHGSSGVTTFAYDVGDQTGNLTLTIGHNPGKSSFQEDRLKKDKRQIQVPVTTLDILAKQMGWFQKASIIHLLKIDVEEYEPWVVRGASRLVNSGLVRNIIVESSSFDSDQINELFWTLWEAGYEIHLTSNSDGHPWK